jgi:hypothetical protein
MEEIEDPKKLAEVAGTGPEAGSAVIKARQAANLDVTESPQPPNHMPQILDLGLEPPEDDER